MKPQPLIAVQDVEASSRWYQRLLGCRGDHGGAEYERLTWNGELVMQLHSFDVEHHHGPIGNKADRIIGSFGCGTWMGMPLWWQARTGRRGKVHEARVHWSRAKHYLFRG